MAPEHRYRATVTWSGNRGAGTRDYRSYGRDHSVTFPGKPDLLGSSDPVYRGDPGRYNPEELLVASLSACHMLSYLHLCADAGIVVESYVDDAEGTLEVTREGGGHFVRVRLRPHVTISSGDLARAGALHADARARCFIANSVNFPVEHEPSVTARSSNP